MTTILNAPLGQQTSPTAAEAVPLSDDYYTLLIDAMKFSPDGTMINGKISVTVASNNITVALKGQDGNDPSSTNPVGVKINGTWRRCTAALSVTKNAGTNWCNAGGAELATKEIDYFVYVFWNTTPATDIVDLGFARIPYGRVYSDFSGTTTNEKYLAYANASAPTSTDDGAVVGRFAATLSATASFNWSVPAYTSVNLIQSPIFQTRILTWTPAYSASASMTFTSTATDLAEYRIVNNVLSMELRGHGTTGGTASTDVYATLPFQARNRTQQVLIPAYVDPTGTNGISGFGYINAATPDQVGTRKYDVSNWGLGASRYINCNGSYTI